MKKFVALLGVMIAPSVFADDGAGVAARMTCADIQAQISELAAVEDPDADTVEELKKLKADYRRSCSRAARGRKTSAGVRIVKETADVAESVSEADEEPADEEPADEEKAQDAVEEVKEVEKTEEKPAEEKPAEEKEVTAEEKPEADKKVDTEKESEDTSEQDTPEQDTPSEDELLEQELANLDAGLCADGTEPNKFGCCGDELFKDLGNTVFACCPKDGGDCFPPIK